MKAKLLRLHPHDNVAVATAPIKAGTTLRLDRVKLQVISNVPMAGKVATRPIAEGEKIIKFGQPIGHATRNIEPGEWVHTHNLASDYLPTPERSPQRPGKPHPEVTPEVAGVADTTATRSVEYDGASPGDQPLAQEVPDNRGIAGIKTAAAGNAPTAPNVNVAETAELSEGSQRLGPSDTHAQTVEQPTGASNDSSAMPQPPATGTLGGEAPSLEEASRKEVSTSISAEQLLEGESPTTNEAEKEALPPGEPAQSPDEGEPPASSSSR